MRSSPIFEVDGSFHRHRAFLAHQAGKPVGEASYRPKTVHRVSAKRWLDHVDEHIRQLSLHPGLVAAKPEEEDPAWRAAKLEEVHLILHQQ